MKKYTLILLIIILLLPWQAMAQQAPVIIATVNYPTVRLRDELAGNVIGELHRGDQLEVHSYMSTNEQFQAWVEVTVLASGLHGWIRADMLSFSREDWQAYLPGFRTYRELASYMVRDTGSYVSYNTVPDQTLNIRSEPCRRVDPSYCQTIVGVLQPHEKATVLGRAIINGLPSWYVYVRRESDGLEGWVHCYFLHRIVGVRAKDVEAIPVIYEASNR